MAFPTKTDWFGLAGTNLVITSSSDGRTATNVEATGQKGEVVANELIGATANPACDYAVKGTWSTAIVLGSVHETNDESIVLTGVNITTAGGAAPTVGASGTQVEADAAAECTYTIAASSLALSPTHHAQILMGAFTLTGTGCHLQSANYAITANATKGTKDGGCISHDVSGARIECQITIVQTSTTAPTLAAGNGWQITAPLACAAPDSQYPTWTATVTKYLAPDED